MSQNDLSHIEIFKIWFLSHHPVYYPHEPGKAGRVCKAASKNQGISLNDKLLPGPNLLQKLVVILFVCWKKAIAITVDIEQMFLQVKVKKK